MHVLRTSMYGDPPVTRFLDPSEKSRKKKTTLEEDLLTEQGRENGPSCTL